MTGERKFAPILPVGAQAQAAQFTQAGPRALIADRAESSHARLWDLEKGFPTGEAIHQDTEIVSAHFSVDGKKLATSSRDGITIVRDAQQGKALAPPLVHRARVNSVHFSPDSARLITASNDRTAGIWEAVSGKRLAPPLEHGAEVWFAQFSPKGDLVVTASMDYSAKIWQTNGALIAKLQHSAPVEYAEFSADGTKVVTASSDGTARLWSAATGKQLTELHHAELVMTARFSPDSLRVITASKDGTVQLWDAATGLKLSDPFRHTDRVISARFSFDGRQAITASMDQTAKIWEVPMATAPIPSWFPELAEAVAGRRLNHDRIIEPVSWTAYADLEARLTKISGTDPCLRWAKLFFADSATPAVAADATAAETKRAKN